MASNEVAAGKVVGFHYTLKDDEGNVIDTSSGADPLFYLHGAGNIVPGLESALTGKTEGDDVEVKVPPAEGYGERHEAAVHKVSREQFPAGAEIEVGMQFGAHGPDGTAVPVWVADMDEQTITIDFNHPLSGKNLNFSVKITEVRDASEEELTHGHPHGPGGHQH